MGFLISFFVNFSIGVSTPNFFNVSCVAGKISVVPSGFVNVNSFAPVSPASYYNFEYEPAGIRKVKIHAKARTINNTVNAVGNEIFFFFASIFISSQNNLKFIILIFSRNITFLNIGHILKKK